jgi:hypothetical protein
MARMQNSAGLVKCRNTASSLSGLSVRSEGKTGLRQFYALLRRIVILFNEKERKK